MDKDPRKLINSLDKAGFEMGISAKRHPTVYLDGKRITTLPSPE